MVCDETPAAIERFAWHTPRPSDAATLDEVFVRLACLGAGTPRDK